MSPTSRRASACCRRCSSRRTPTGRWWAATAPAWAAARRPRCTWSSRPINALMQPRVARHVAQLDDLIDGLDAEARDTAGLRRRPRRRRDAAKGGGRAGRTRRSGRSSSGSRSIAEAAGPRWRYVEGPSGKGRAQPGHGQRTGCSSVWASTYPYNPYPVPLGEPSLPGLAVDRHRALRGPDAEDGGWLRRDASRRAAAGRQYDAEDARTALAALDWTRVHRRGVRALPADRRHGRRRRHAGHRVPEPLRALLASGKPIRVVVLDTQVYSNTGGQACTADSPGRWRTWRLRQGAARQAEERKELSLLAIAHRGVYVQQASQAPPAHLMAGVLKGLHKRRPALFNVYTPCPTEHGLADDGAHAGGAAGAREPGLPVPDLRSLTAARSFADCLSLDGNPSVDDAWPAYTPALSRRRRAANSRWRCR